MEKVENIENVEEMVEEKVEEQNLEVEFTSNSEYISSAYYSLASVSEFDIAMLSKADFRRVMRIKRQSLRIISECLNEMYDEIFEDDEENSDMV